MGGVEQTTRKEQAKSEQVLLLWLACRHDFKPTARASSFGAEPASLCVGVSGEGEV